MAFRDLFKRKKSKEKPSDMASPLEPGSVSGKAVQGEEKKGEKETTVKKRKERKVSKKRKIDARILSVLRAPHITEKTTALMEENKYTFKVSLGTNKSEVKKAVEQLYNVDVLTVRTIKVPRKRKRVGRTFGWRKAFKKAIVEIKEGQKIEELSR